MGIRPKENNEFPLHSKGRKRALERELANLPEQQKFSRLGNFKFLELRASGRNANFPSALESQFLLLTSYRVVKTFVFIC